MLLIFEFPIAVIAAWHVPDFLGRLVALAVWFAWVEATWSVISSLAGEAKTRWARAENGESKIDIPAMLLAAGGMLTLFIRVVVEAIFFYWLIS